MPIANGIMIAAGVIDQEGFAAAMGDQQFVKNVSCAFGSRAELPARRRPHGGFSHKNAMVAALLDSHPVKNVVARLPHENTQIIAREDRVLDHIMVEIQVQRNAGAVLSCKFKWLKWLSSV